MKNILLIGGCGSGKTWVMLELLRLIETKPAKIGLNYFRIDEKKKIGILGIYDGGIFQGSDRLSMAVMKDVENLKFVQKKNNLIFVAEGDRFTNQTFITKMNPLIVKISDNGAEGRKKRNSNQSERQIKSIQTRVNNIKENYLVKNSQEAFLLIKKILEL